MKPFIPPYPPRFPSPIPDWKRLLIARKNFLAMWEESAFEIEYDIDRVFLRQTFLCNSPESVKFAFTQHNPSFERKSPQMRHALAPLLGDGLFISDGATWRTRRPIVASILHGSKLAEFEPAIMGAVLDTRQRWQTSNGQTLDILEESARLTADVICRTLFGMQLSAEYAGQVISAFSDYQREVPQTDLISLLGLPDWLPRRHSPRLRQTAAQIHTALDDILAAYRRQDITDNAVIGRLLAAQDENGQPLSDEALRNEIAVLFMAGHETTANSLAWTWYLLSQAPDVEARLHAEIDSVLGGRLPTLKDLPHLVYTRAVFDEALRLYPPVPILAREAVREEHFREHRIRKGALVLVVPWLLHRHRKYWDEPDRFYPDRFLPEHSASLSKYAYVPFSIGPRVCASSSFGLTEAVLCLATLAQAFVLRLKPGHVVAPVARLTLRPDGGLPMNVYARSHPDHFPDTRNPALT